MHLNLHVLGTSALVSVLGLIGVIVWRVREARTAVTVRKIVIPPLGMSTGFCMFLVPAFRVPLLWAAVAFLIGALLLSWPLLVTSRLVIRGDEVVMHRSKAFFLVIIVLAAIRYFARDYFDTFISIQQTAGLFFILAFGIILRWRMQMLSQYRALTAIR
ncbi:MAG: cytochrome c biogenesis protein CcdC [Silvibacterium sp.]|nr:cytochrome c biogenesis protein CcdC [Silvibacterium sp.]